MDAFKWISLILFGCSSLSCDTIACEPGIRAKVLRKVNHDKKMLFPAREVFMQDAHKPHMLPIKADYPY